MIVLSESPTTPRASIASPARRNTFALVIVVVVGDLIPCLSKEIGIVSQSDVVLLSAAPSGAKEVAACYPAWRSVMNKLLK